MKQLKHTITAIGIMICSGLVSAGCIFALISLLSFAVDARADDSWYEKYQREQRAQERERRLEELEERNEEIEDRLDEMERDEDWRDFEDRQEELRDEDY